MTIQLNGNTHEIPDQDRVSVPKLLESLDLGEAPVLVELNGEALLARELDQHTVNDGDSVELVRMVAGG